MVSFPSMGKKLAPQGEILFRRRGGETHPVRRRALHKNRSIIAPSSVWPSASHLPPRGKAFAGEGLRAADSRPYRENSVEIPHLHKILRGS